MTYTVEIKNISETNEKRLQRGDTKQVRIEAGYAAEAVSPAVKKFFPGFSFWTEDVLNDGTQVGRLCAKGTGGATNLYGRIRVTVQEG